MIQTCFPSRETVLLRAMSRRKDGEVCSTSARVRRAPGTLHLRILAVAQATLTFPPLQDLRQSMRQGPALFATTKQIKTWLNERAPTEQKLRTQGGRKSTLEEAFERDVKTVFGTELQMDSHAARAAGVRNTSHLVGFAMPVSASRANGVPGAPDLRPRRHAQPELHSTAPSACSGGACCCGERHAICRPCECGRARGQLHRREWQRVRV